MMTVIHSVILWLVIIQWDQALKISVNMLLFQIDFYGDFDASFHKSLSSDLTIDLSGALLGTRSHR